MILIFDYFETLLNSRSMDFNRGLKVFWETYYRDRCSFEEMKSYGEELFGELILKHNEGLEFPFVKEELPLYAEKFGGDVVSLSVEEEADFLMRCNDFELEPGTEDILIKCSQKDIPMYVLSNSGFRGDALMLILNRFGIGKYFKKLWSSAEFGRIKPDREFFELAISTALSENPNDKREDIIFVGDMYDADVIGAHNAGIKAAWLNKKGGVDTNNLASYEASSIRGLSKLFDTVATI